MITKTPWSVGDEFVRFQFCIGSNNYTMDRNQILRLASMYSFPTVYAALRNLCQTTYSPDEEFKPALVGIAFFFQWEPATLSAKALKITLDQSLTFDLAVGLQRKPFASPVLVFYGAVQNGFKLWVCGNRATAFVDALVDSAGYTESGQESIASNAVPFFYLDGQYPHRVYAVDGSIRRGRNWIQDLGSLVGTYIAPANRGDYERVRDDPVGCNDYSAILPETELTLKKKDARVVITQALIEFTDDPREDMT